MQVSSFKQECHNRLVIEMEGISYEISSEEVITDKDGDLIYRASLQKLDSSHVYDFVCYEVNGELVSFVNF